MNQMLRNHNLFSARVMGFIVVFDKQTIIADNYVFQVSLDICRVRRFGTRCGAIAQMAMYFTKVRAFMLQILTDCTVHIWDRSVTRENLFNGY
jgi:hypothetical protein